MRRSLFKADDFVSAGTKLGDDLKKATNWVKQENGFFDVMVHGSPNSFHVKHNGNWVDIDHRTLATFKKSEWQGEPIRLLSCSSGACPTGVAQNLANKLKVPVKAPDDTLWVYNTGKLTIGPKPFVNTGSGKFLRQKGRSNETKKSRLFPRVTIWVSGRPKYKRPATNITLG
ncbi:MAG TPA: hypothetical protein VNK49_00515 [Anaerolineales bacterium]|nr:hypothetical protein [Anaerolineales bacterium]